MEYIKLRKHLSFLKRTPFHPQWLVYRRERKNLTEIGSALHGRVLDIGCSDQRLKVFLKNETRYIGLDYYDTAEHWYQTKPQVYGDAAALPFPDSSMDSVVLLDVLEHLAKPENCIKEIFRVLTPDGLFIIQVPFLYPLHDEPLDFTRWTIHGLRSMAERFGFEIGEETTTGKPLETSGLLLNIALGKTVLNWINKRSFLSVFALLLPFLIVGTNIMSWILAGFSPPDDMMPYSSRLTMKKAGLS